MLIKQCKLTVSWGNISIQIFGDNENPNSKPILALHGYLDNSNSFRPLAKHLTRSGQYYIVAIDLPGMGLSSKIPDTITYSTRLYVMYIHRVSKFLRIQKFIIMAHGFGCSMALAYANAYESHVLGIILLDFVMKEIDVLVEGELEKYWKEDKQIDFSKEKIFIFETLIETNQICSEMDYKSALKEVLAQREQIDELSAKILLERELVLNENKNLEFNRDSRLLVGFPMKSYHEQHIGSQGLLFLYLKSPLLFIYAIPASYGNKKLDEMIRIVNELKLQSESIIEMIPINGNHYFHMLKPAQINEKILEFLNENLNVDNLMSTRQKVSKN